MTSPDNPTRGVPTQPSDPDHPYQVARVCGLLWALTCVAFGADQPWVAIPSGISAALLLRYMATRWATSRWLAARAAQRGEAAPPGGASRG